MLTHSPQQRFPQLAHSLDRVPMVGLMCAGTILAVIALAGARTLNPRDTCVSLAAEKTSPAAEENANSPQLLLEGTEIHERLGTFRTTGDRLTFVAADQQEYFIGLENRILERIARTIADNPNPPQWIVSGTITEYQGANYLLLNRAVQQTRLRPEEDAP
jgi:hypothetical protein